ncbi:Ldh family oxidoreductase [uncultured Roseicyclus sp.]|uniref:Ldh family oxidoreductase n=1 Tax=uncultured Roseicyclus sp. TaxID=543072 RepID=UPI00261EAF4B|nr:Ldh family oxidoreductase [uncultured Roseicyclus sp.]
MAATDGQGATITLERQAAEGLAADLLVAARVPQADAAIAARCLVRADLRGVDTHGMVRLPGYLDRIARGLVDPAPALVFETVAPAAARLDGQNGLGFVVASRAVDHGIAMARQMGLGLIGVRNSTHFGMAANYLLQAIEAGFAAMVYTNASPAMPPWGGRAEMFGTSPFAVGVPAPGSVPFVLDMAPSVVARGKIRKAAREGRPIPEGWALDAAGRDTTDAQAAMAGGVLLPIGGPKGAGMSMMMDILCGVLTGARYGGEVGDQYKRFDRPQGVGHFILVMRPDLFLPADEIAARMGDLVTRVKANPLAEGADQIFMPGEIEALREAERLAHGIPYRRDDLAPLVDLARAGGISLPHGL